MIEFDRALGKSGFIAKITRLDIRNLQGFDLPLSGLQLQAIQAIRIVGIGIT